MTRDQLFRAKVNQTVMAGRRILIVALKALPLSLLLAFIGWLIFTKLEKKYNIIKERKKLATGFVFYIAFLIQVVILQRPFGSQRGIIWVPFATPGGDNLIVLLSIANGILFVPLGMLLTSLFREKLNSIWKLAGVVFGISLLIEVLQYVLGCGFSEVEDVIMNVAGGMIGYWIVRRKK